MTDARTLRVYAEQADTYAAVFDGDIPQDLIDFADLLAPGGQVLDLGCGPGGMAAWLAARGFDVTAWDAAPEMVALAARHAGVTAQRHSFDALTATAAYDGLWASFSLLHARRADLPDLITRMARATRPGGAVYIAMKTGTGEGRDALGRHYAYVTEAELTFWMKEAGLTVTTIRHGHGKGLAGTDDPYVTVTARA